MFRALKRCLNNKMNQRQLVQPGVDLDTLLGSRKDFESQVVTRDTLEQKKDSARANRVKSFKSIIDELSPRNEQQLEPRLSCRLGETSSQKTFIGASPIGEPHDVRGSTSSQLDMAAEFPSHEEMESFTWNNPMEGGDAGRNPSQTETVKQLRYERNVQYTFVTSNEDLVPQNSPASDYEDAPPEDISVCKIDEESKSEIVLETIPSTEELQPKVSEVSVTENIEGLLEERYDFLQQISSSPLYVNEFFAQPWKVVSNISEALVTEVTLSAEKDLSFGEDHFVDDFLQLELDM